MAVVGSLTVFVALAALEPLVLWHTACATPSLTKEDCSAEGKRAATGHRHIRRALRHPVESARLTLSALWPG